MTLPVDSGDAIDFGLSFEIRLIPEDVAVATAIAIATVVVVVVEIPSNYYPVFLGVAVAPGSAVHLEPESRPDRNRELVELVGPHFRDFD